jgi:hypothetical protein
VRLQRHLQASDQLPEADRREVLGAVFGDQLAAFLLELVHGDANERAAPGRGVRHGAACNLAADFHLQRTSGSSAYSKLVPGKKLAPDANGLDELQAGRVTCTP